MSNERPQLCLYPLTPQSERHKANSIKFLPRSVLNPSGIFLFSPEVFHGSGPLIWLTRGEKTLSLVQTEESVIRKPFHPLLLSAPEVRRPWGMSLFMSSWDERRQPPALVKTKQTEVASYVPWMVSTLPDWNYFTKESPLHKF